MPDINFDAVRRGLLSPAVLIATAALFVALGGTGYAALSGQAKAATSGIMVENFHTTNFTVPANSTFGAWIQCPTGTSPVGGGGLTDGQPGTYVIGSAPYDSTTKTFSSVANAWEIWVDNTTTRAHTVATYAVCASGVTEVTSLPSAKIVGGRTRTKP